MTLFGDAPDDARWQHHPEAETAPIHFGNGSVPAPRRVQFTGCAGFRSSVLVFQKWAVPFGFSAEPPTKAEFSATNQLKVVLRKQTTSGSNHGSVR